MVAEAKATGDRSDVPVMQIGRTPRKDEDEEYYGELKL